MDHECTLLGIDCHATAYTGMDDLLRHRLEAAAERGLRAVAASRTRAPAAAMIMRMGLARFQLVTSGTDVQLHVNDEPVEGFASVQVLAAPGQVPQLVVQQRGDVEVVGEGVVHVQPEASGARQAVLDWLEQLDPVTLEQQALDNQGWGSAGLASEILDVLKQLAGSLPE